MVTREDAHRHHFREEDHSARGPLFGLPFQRRGNQLLDSLSARRCRRLRDKERESVLRDPAAGGNRVGVDLHEVPRPFDERLHRERYTCALIRRAVSGNSSDHRACATPCSG